MHTAFRHFLFSVIFNLLTVVSSDEMHVLNMPTIQQTEWVASSQNVQSTSASVFVYNKYIVTPLKSVYPLTHFSPFDLAFLKKERHIVSKIYQYHVAATLIRHLFRLKTDSTTSSDDDDLPLS